MNEQKEREWTMNHRLLIAKGALFLGLVLASANADAADDKLYPGITCRHSGNLSGTFGTFLGTVDNLSSTSAMAVLCPFVRDASSIASANIQVFDRHTTQDVSCDIRYEFASGPNVTFFVSSNHSTGFGSDVKTIFCGGVFGGDYYYAQCVVPPAENGNVSHIVRFRISEND
jgi:hypothetical protein